MKHMRCVNFEEEMPDDANGQYTCFLRTRLANWTKGPFI